MYIIRVVAYPPSLQETLRILYGIPSSTIACFDNNFVCDSNQENCRYFTAPGLYRYPWKDRNTEITEEDLSLALLSRALAGSSTCSGAYNLPLEVESHYTQEYRADDLWKVEARHWFERSLASMQQAVFDTVRGRYQGFPKPKEIPPNYQGLCQMVKFTSVGWRNVSFWGLFGLLSLAAGVSLASVQTKEEELWLCIGVRFLYNALR